MQKSSFSRLLARAKELGFTNLADGTNKDDLGEYRPCLKAKEELGVLSPLINLRKFEIRELSRELLSNSRKAKLRMLANSFAARKRDKRR